LAANLKIGHFPGIKKPAPRRKRVNGGSGGSKARSVGQTMIREKIS